MSSLDTHHGDAASTDPRHTPPAIERKQVPGDVPRPVYDLAAHAAGLAFPQLYVDPVIDTFRSARDALAKSFTETSDERDIRVEKETKVLMGKAAETVMRYIEKQGLFVDHEPEALLAMITNSELFANELEPLVRTACEGEGKNEHVRTSLSPLVSVRTEKGDTVETVHGIVVSIPLRLVKDPHVKKAWKREENYDFQNVAVWQRMFPGTQPTRLLQEQEAQILTEAQAAEKDIRDAYENGDLSQESFVAQLKLVDKLFNSINVDADDLSLQLNQAGPDLTSMLGLVNPNGSKEMFTADRVRAIALKTLQENKGLHADDIGKLLTKLEDSAKTVAGMKDFLATHNPNAQAILTPFYRAMRDEFGIDAVRAYIRIDNASHAGGGMNGDISDENINGYNLSGLDEEEPE